MAKKTKIEESEYKTPAVTDTPPALPRHYKPDAHVYTAKEIKFLDVYVETLDKDQALKASGLKMAQLKKNKYIMDELLKLQRICQKKYRLKMAGAKHMDLMDKVEDVFDQAVEGKDLKTAVGASSTLARMSEAAMRASGEFKDERADNGVHIQVNINMGDEEPKTIEGEATTINIDTGEE